MAVSEWMWLAAESVPAGVLKGWFCSQTRPDYSEPAAAVGGVVGDVWGVGDVLQRGDAVWGVGKSIEHL